MGKRQRRRSKAAAPPPAATFDYPDAEGNVLTLRESVSAGTAAKLREPAGGAAASSCCSSASPSAGPSPGCR